MTDTPTKIVVNCSTGEREILPLTAEEIAERDAMAVQAEADRVAQEAADQAKEDNKASGIAKLLALGLTEAEANALIG